MLLLTTAVDAVGTLRVLSRWFVLLGEVRLCVYPSAGTISMHLASEYIYPYRDDGGSCSQRRRPRRVSSHNGARWRLSRGTLVLKGAEKGCRSKTRPGVEAH